MEKFVFSLKELDEVVKNNFASYVKVVVIPGLDENGFNNIKSIMESKDNVLSVLRLEIFSSQDVNLGRKDFILSYAESHCPFIQEIVLGDSTYKFIRTSNIDKSSGEWAHGKMGYIKLRNKDEN